MADNATILTVCNVTTWNATFTQNSSICSSNSLRNSTILQPGSTLHGGPNPFPFDPKFKIFSYISLGLISVLGVCGNGVVLYVLGYRKKRLTSCDIYILALAFADFISSVCAPVAILNQIITGLVGWFYGKAMCHILPAVMPIAYDASVWLLVAISYDRYRIIAKPMAPHPSHCRIYAIVIIIWTCAFAYNLPLLLTLELRGNICSFTSRKILKGYKLEFFLTTFFWWLWAASNFILVIVNWRTIRALKRSRVQHANNQAMLKRDKENANIVKMFLIIVVLFVAFTIPQVFYAFTKFFLLDIMGLKNVDATMMTNSGYALMILSTTAVCINPIIYAKLHKEINQFFRVARKRLINCIAQCVQSIFRPNSKDAYAFDESSAQSREIYVVAGP